MLLQASPHSTRGERNGILRALMHSLEPTVLVYSAHGAPWRIHGELLGRRALAHPGDHRLLYLPVSEPPRGGDEMGSQHFSWGRLAPTFHALGAEGLEPAPFFFSSALTRKDAATLFDWVDQVPVVLLGSGITPLGLWRLKLLGSQFWGDEHLFARLLARRQARGLLTAGSSAGAKQLCSVLGTRGESRTFREGFHLARDVAVEVHYEGRWARSLRRSAARKKRCFWFGLPNDSALAVSSGRLAPGLEWQLIRFVLDTSWDAPRDHWHVKTRQGMKIDHFYPDGRHWAFNDGDAMLLVKRRGNRHFRHAWMASAGRILDYTSQHELPFPDLGAVLEAIRQGRRGAARRG